jgi:hypothetical protein
MQPWLLQQRRELRVYFVSRGHVQHLLAGAVVVPALPLGVLWPQHGSEQRRVLHAVPPRHRERDGGRVVIGRVRGVLRGQLREHCRRGRVHAVRCGVVLGVCRRDAGKLVHPVRRGVHECGWGVNVLVV